MLVTRVKAVAILLIAAVAALVLLLSDWSPTTGLTPHSPPADEQTRADSLAVLEPIASGLRSVLVLDAPPNSVGSIPGETPGGDASVRVVLTDSELERRVSRFRVRFRADSVDLPKRSRFVRTDHGVAESSFSIPPEGSLHLRIELVSPVTPGTVFTEVDLEPDDDLAIELILPAVAHLHGVVVDTAGRPIPGAVVFYGDAITARGDELCPDTFEGRVTGKGACTDEDGSFVLLGEGTDVTAWHAHHSISTVDASLASRIVLQDRASIVGVLLDDDALGMVEVRIHLDDGDREVYTGDGGLFVLENVEAGMHCLSIEAIGFYFVEVSPPEDCNVALYVPNYSVTIHLQRGSEPHEGPFDGALLGPLGATSAITIQDVSCEDGSLRDVRLVKGLYLLVGLNGEVVQLSIDDTIVRADLGTARLVIEGPPGAHVVVVPDRLAGGAVLALATRCAQRIPANGTLTVDPIPEGAYRVGLLGSGYPLTQVEVPQGGQRTVTLNR